MSASKVIVPIGMRREGDRLLPIAVEVAAMFEAPIQLVHVVTDLGGRATTDKRSWLEPLARRFGAELRLIEHSTVSHGLRDLVVEDSGAVVCMLVDATGDRIDGLLGSISEDLLRSGHQRFVLVGPSVPTTRSMRDGPVVICVDGSAFSEAILPDATEWTQLTSGAAFVVQAEHGAAVPPDASETAYVQAIARGLDIEDAEWEILHDRHAADAIVDFSRGIGAGSIAMTSHGRDGLDRFALGSTAIRVVHEAPCPVLVTRPSAPTIVPVAAQGPTHRSAG